MILPAKSRETMENISQLLRALNSFMWVEANGSTMTKDQGWSLEWQVAFKSDRTMLYVRLWPEPASSQLDG